MKRITIDEGLCDQGQEGAVCESSPKCRTECFEDAFWFSQGMFFIMPNACNGCGSCIPLCPHQALSLEDDGKPDD